jgi:hypothetical protein
MTPRGELDAGQPTPRPAAGGPPPGALPAHFGRYRIIRRLGRGGMGTVYLAHDSQLDRRVALKIPHFASEDGPAVLERFHREARAAAALNHPNICPVHDIGEVDGTPYLTMAFIEGESLAARPRPLPPEQAVALVRTLALALEEAHQHGIIHRDLKPSNIMINPRGEPVIMDFGLARRICPGDVRLTRSGQMLGTPAYMSPEQVSGDTAAMGPGCDIYSLGVILYELLTGRLPFEGSAGELLAKILITEPTPLRTHRPDLDPALEAICHKALAKKSSERYPSMAAFARALGEYLQAGSWGARPEDVAPTPRMPAETGVGVGLPSADETRVRTATAPPTWRRAGASRRLFGIGMIVAGVVVGILVGVYFLTPLFRARHTGSGDGRRGVEKPREREFLGLRHIPTAIREHLRKVPAADRRYQRYLTLTPMHNNPGVTDGQLQRYREWLATVVQRLSTKPDLDPPEAVDAERTIFVVDLRRFQGDQGNFWEDVLKSYPYGLTHDRCPGGEVSAAAREVYELTETDLPWLRGDWLVVTGFRQLGEGQEEAVRAFAEPLGLDYAARELGLAEAAQLRAAIRGSSLLRAVGLGPLAEGGTIPRSTWESLEGLISPYQEAARVLELGTPKRFG